MIRWFLNKRLTVLAVCMMVSLFSVGRAWAWEYDQGYGGLGAKSWSPSGGRLAADVGRDSVGARATQPYAYNIWWSAATVTWIKANAGTVSVTFHSSYAGYTGPSGGCDNKWASEEWLASNLPGVNGHTYWRSCFFGTKSEIRIWPDKNLLVGGRLYWAQSYYKDYSGAAETRGQFNVDTYWDGSENFHQKYCTLDHGFTAIVCP
jgi:hypothetical protein